MGPNKTVLYPEHINRGAKMVDFAGWSMPVEYTSMLKEAKEVRQRAGLFDVSHMGKITVEGPQAQEFLQYVCSNDIASLGEGRMQYNLLLNERGGIIDDLMVYNLGGYFLLVVNAARTEADFSWLQKHSSSYEIAIKDKSGSYALLALQGRNATAILQAVSGAQPAELAYMACSIFAHRDFGSLLISRSGYSGEDGFEILVENDYARLLWRRLEEAGIKYGLSLCGLGARDILRLEAGYPLYGTDMNEETSPYEAGLGWAVKSEQRDFLGAAGLRERKHQLRQRRFGFVMEEKGFPRCGYPILNRQGVEIGTVKSGAYSPSLGQFIGSGFLDTAYASEGKDILVRIRSKDYAARTKRFPFLKLGVKKEGKNG